MKRRSFLTLLATLVSWVSVRPKVHADAVKADPSFAFQGETRMVLQFWDVNADGRTHLVQELWVPRERRCARRMTARRGPRYTGFVEGDEPGTVFEHASTYVDTLAPRGPLVYQNYEYVSGPKWWEDLKRVAFHARLDDGQLWPFTVEDVRRQRILSYQFLAIVWDRPDLLTAQEAAFVESRLRLRPGEPIARIRFGGTPR